MEHMENDIECRKILLINYLDKWWWKVLKFNESASITSADSAKSGSFNELITRFWSVDAVKTKGCIGQGEHAGIPLAGMKTVLEIDDKWGSLTRNLWEKSVRT